MNELAGGGVVSVNEQIAKDLRWQLKHAEKRIQFMRDALNAIIGADTTEVCFHVQDIALDALIADTKLDGIACERESKGKQHYRDEKEG